MLKLRLSRGGTKKRPVYKVVVADSRFARDGRFIEKVGFFNPLLPKDKKERVGLEAERIKYWLGQGAQPTTRVARILGENELMPMPANGNNPKKAVPKKERKKRNEDSLEIVNKRMSKAKSEISHWIEYDYVLINDDLVTCTNEVVTILKAERKKRDRQKFIFSFIEKLLN